MRPGDFKTGRMQRNAAPMPLKLNTDITDSVDPQNGIHLRIDDLPSQQPKSQGSKISHSLFSSNFNFAAGGAAPSPPPSAGVPGHIRPRGLGRSKSPSARSSMIEDEDSEWDMTKELPHFQPALRRPSLLTPPTTSDARRQSYDRTTHLGYDDGSTELIPQGRRSSVPAHHLRPDPSPERMAPSEARRRSSLATTSITRNDVEEHDRTKESESLSEVDSAEEELAPDVEGVQAQTADLKLDDTSKDSVPKPSPSLKRESDDADPNVYSAVNTPIPNPFASLGGVPPAYILKRLLDLGPYFVGHEATAQAFIEAVPMDEKSELYKIEIVPRDEKVMPFRLVKRYKYSDDSDDSDATPPPDSPVDDSDTEYEDDEVDYTSPRLPIHVEYALFRLPLLGSMLLSGQVFCGDTLKVPMPYPEVWTAVVGWMYTNKIVRLPGFDVHEEAEMVRDCIEFLGGCV